MTPLTTFLAVCCLLFVAIIVRTAARANPQRERHSEAIGGGGVSFHEGRNA